MILPFVSYKHVQVSTVKKNHFRCPRQPLHQTLRPSTLYGAAEGRLRHRRKSCRGYGPRPGASRPADAARPTLRSILNKLSYLKSCCFLTGLKCTCRSSWPRSSPRGARGLPTRRATRRRRTCRPRSPLPLRSIKDRSSRRRNSSRPPRRGRS